MANKDWLGRTKDQGESTAAKEPSEQERQERQDARENAPVVGPTKQAPMHLNPETAHDPDQDVNPHNEALAQRPQPDANERLRDAELAEQNTTRGRLKAWRNRNFLGGPSSAAWEEFDQLIDELDRPDDAARRATEARERETRSATKAK